MCLTKKGIRRWWRLPTARWRISWTATWWISRWATAVHRWLCCTTWYGSSGRTASWIWPAAASTRSRRFTRNSTTLRDGWSRSVWQNIVPGTAVGIDKRARREVLGPSLQIDDWWVSYILLSEHQLSNCKLCFFFRNVWPGPQRIGGHPWIW